MRFHKIAISCLFLISTTISAEGLQSIYQQAKAADPIWLGANASNRAAQETTQQSFSAFLPNINLSANSTSNFQDSDSLGSTAADRREKFNSNSWTLNLVQPIFRMANYATHRQAKASVRQADIQLASEAQNLIIRVAQAYFNVLSAESDLTSIQAEKRAISRQLDQAKKRFEVGLTAITDVHEAQASYDLAQANEIAAENQRLLASVALSEITGKNHGKLNDLNEKFELITPDPANMDQWVKRAIDSNLSLSAAMIGVEVAQENVKIKRAAHYPTLNLVASGSNNTSHSNVGSNTDSETFRLQLELPIYSGGSTTSQVRQALAELGQAKQKLTQAKRATEKLARDAYLEIITKISRIQALEQAVISAQSAVDATEAGFEVGTRTIVDVLNAQRTLHNSSNALQKTRYTYLLNSLKLKQAVGSLSEESVSSVNQLLDTRSLID